MAPGLEYVLWRPKASGCGMLALLCVNRMKSMQGGCQLFETPWMILLHNWPAEEYKVQRILTVCAPGQTNLRCANVKRE